jgi:hypothetical protein
VRSNTTRGFGAFRPVVVTPAVPYFRRQPVTLAASRGKRPRSLTLFLSPPAVVNPFVPLPPFSFFVTTSLSPQPRRIFISSRLPAPTVVAFPPNFGPGVRLTKPLDRVPVTLSGLGRPVVLGANTDYPYGPMVQLAYSLRGKAKPRLPVVVVP